MLVSLFAIGAAALSLKWVYQSVRSPRIVYLGFVMLIMMIIYHVVSEVAIRLISSSTGQESASSGAADVVSIALSVSIVLFAGTYSLVMRRASERRVVEEDSALTRRVLDWRIWSVALVPMLILTWQGRGYKSFQQIGVTDETYLLSGATASLLLIVLPIVTGGIIANTGGRFAVAILTVQSTTMLMIGQRLEIVVVAVLALFVAGMLGVRLSVRQYVAIGVILVLGFGLLTVVRATSGRAVFQTELNTEARLDALTSAIGSGSLTDASDVEAVMNRIDGNSYAASVYENQVAWTAGTFSPLTDAFLSTVPSFLWPEKSSRDLSVRSEQYFVAAYYGLPIQDYLPTRLGSAVAYAGIPGLLIAGALMGLGLGFLDRFIGGRVTAARVVLGVTVLGSVLLYERGLSRLVTELRVLVVLIPVVLVASAIIRRRPPESKVRPQALTRDEGVTY